MASFTVQSGQVAVHAKTLAPGVADSVTLADSFSGVTVFSDRAAVLYFSVDGSPATDAGAHCFLLQAGAARSVTIPGVWSNANVSLVSSGSPTYSVIKGRMAMAGGSMTITSIDGGNVE